MKKAFLIIGLLFFAAACKQAGGDGTTTSSDSLGKSNDSLSKNRKNLKKGSTWTKLAKTDCNPAAASPCADDIIVLIDKTTVNKAWVDANCKCFCTRNIPNITCDYYVVNLGLISSDQADIAKWLGTNAAKICYNDSYPYIRKSHILTNAPIIAGVEDEIKNIRDTKIPLDELVSKIPNFNTVNYETYIRMEENTTTHQYDFKPEQNFANGMYCYSVPLLKSIIKYHKIKPADFKNHILRFSKIKDPAGSIYPIIAFRFEGPGVKEYYDYSTNPNPVPDPPQPPHARPHFNFY